MRRLTIALLLTAALVPAAACRRATPVKPAAVSPSPSAYELETGRNVYVTYCATCHGATGAGDGFNAFNLDPHPRDFSDPVYQKKRSDADLVNVIRRGGAGVGLSSLMPPWEHTLSDRQIEDVVLYVRSLKKH